VIISKKDREDYEEGVRDRDKNAEDEIIINIMLLLNKVHLSI
jgi:hypothetical protein